MSDTEAQADPLVQGESFPHDHDPYRLGLSTGHAIVNPLVQTEAGEQSSVRVVGTMALDVENSIAARGATGPRVDLLALHDKVRDVKFMRPGQVFDPYVASELDRLTLAFVTMENGWVVVGQSSCADASNYEYDKGCRFAVDDAMRQIWGLEGYLLKENLFCQSQVNTAMASTQVSDVGMDRIHADLMEHLAQSAVTPDELSTYDGSAMR